jgi:hypothetical protein
LTALEELIQQRGFGPIKEYQVENVFRFGNGSVERSQVAVRVPVGVAQQLGIIDAAVISGHAPLLIGRPTSEKMRARIDFSDGSLHFLDTKAKMTTKCAGQVLIDILDYPNKAASSQSGHQDRRTGDAANDNLMGCKPRGGSVRYKHKVTLKKRECGCLFAQLNVQQNRSHLESLLQNSFRLPGFRRWQSRRG